MRHDTSPMQLVTGSESPFLILHGTNVPSIPISESQRFNDTQKIAGVDAQFYTFPGGVHGFDSTETYHILSHAR